MMIMNGCFIWSIMAYMTIPTVIICIAPIPLHRIHIQLEQTLPVPITSQSKVVIEDITQYRCIRDAFYSQKILTIQVFV